MDRTRPKIDLTHRETVLLASSQFPSGVAWLLNFFVELDVLIYRGNSPEKTWLYDSNNHTYRVTEGDQILKQWIPALTDQPDRTFAEPLCIRWSHEFPNSTNVQQKVILMMRDGRDAVYSQYKREHAADRALQDMLRMHYAPLGLPPAETWAAHAYLWLQRIPKNRLHIIRFEDIKTNPLPEVKRLLTFLGVQRSEEDIQRAITSSSFERAKQAETAYRAQQTQTQFAEVNRKGQPGEWKTNYTPETLRSFTGLPLSVLNTFGYEADISATYTDARCRLLLKIKKAQVVSRWFMRAYLRSVTQRFMQQVKNTIKNLLPKQVRIVTKKLKQTVTNS